MLGGNVSELSANENGIVVKSGSSLIILNPSNLQWRATIHTNALKFIAIDNQVIVLTFPNIITHYLFLNGSYILKSQLSLIPQQYHFTTSSLIYTNSDAVHRYSLFDHNSEEIFKYPMNDSEVHIATSRNKVFLSVGQDVINESKVTRSFAKTIVTIVASETMLAIGDSSGKVSILNFKLEILLNPPQWHAHPVNVLQFNQDGDYLYSAGKEGVLVQWHVHTQRKALFPRQGSEITGLALMGDNAVISLRGKNAVQQVSLQGSGSNVFYQGIHYNPTISQFQQLDQKSVMTNGVAGHLQIIDIRKGFQSNIDVCKRNYVSDIDKQLIPRNQVDITHFSQSNCGTNLLCAIQLDNQKYQISQLKFLKKVNNEYHVVSSISNPHNKPISGVITYKALKQELFVTWSQDQSIRIWQFNTNWICIYHRTFRGLLNLSSTKDGQLAILTNTAYFIIDPFTDTVVDSIQLQIEDKAVIHMNSSYIIKFYEQVFNIIQMFLKNLSIWNIQTKTKSKTQLKIQNVSQMVVSEHSIFMQSMKGDKALFLLYCINTATILKASTCAFETKQIFSFISASTYDYFAVDADNNYVNVFSLPIGKHRKSSVLIETETIPSTAPIQTVDTKLQEVFEKQSTHDAKLKYNMVLIAERSRKLQQNIIILQRKDFNIKQYLPEQSHLAPPLAILTRQLDQYKDVNTFQPSEIQIEQEENDEDTAILPHKSHQQDRIYQDFLKLRNQLGNLEVE